MIHGIPVDGPGVAVLHFASAASPPAYLEQPIATLEGRLDRHAARARAGAQARRRSRPAGVDERGLRRSRPEPAARELLGQRQPGRARGRSTTRPSASARRSRWRTTAPTGSTRKIARIFNTYGPFLRPEDGRVVSNFLAQAIDGRPLTVYGDGSQTRSFCYVDDLVVGLLGLLESRTSRADEPRQPQRADACSSSRTRCSSVTGSTSEIVFEPLPEDDPDAAPSRHQPRRAGARLASRRSISAKVSPARTTGTGGAVTQRLTTR